MKSHKFQPLWSQRAWDLINVHAKWVKWTHCRELNGQFTQTPTISLNTNTTVVNAFMFWVNRPFNWSVCRDRDSDGVSRRLAKVHSSTGERPLRNQSMTGRPVTLKCSHLLWFEERRAAARALQTASACGRRRSPTITWAQMKHDPPPPLLNATITPSAPAALLLFLHLSSA